MNQPTITHNCPCDTPEPLPGKRLGDEAFKCVIKLTPLVSIDLIVRRPDGRVWLGRRRNRPAKDALFLPGGRITKNEKREDAFERITLEELGVKMPFGKALFFNSYDHIYADNYFDQDGFGTHYVTLG